MKCKKCQAEMDEGMKFCPACGAAQEEKTGLSTGKIALLVVLAVAAIAVVAALFMGGNGTEPAATTAPPETTAPVSSVVEGTVPADGNHDDVTCKGTYSVDNDRVLAEADKVVATMGEVKLTNAELQVYYWMQVYDFLNQYGSYASMFGLDYAKPLDQQMSFDGKLTWQQYFLDIALNNWIHYQAMSLDAEASGYELEQDYAEYLEELPNTLAESAIEMGYESAEDMIRRDMGPGSTMEGYLNYLRTYYMGYMYYGDSLEAMEITDAEIEAYFDAHAEEYKAKGLEKTDEIFVDVRHILISPKGGDAATEADWAAAEKKADEVLADWLRTNPTEDGFAVMAEAYSEDPGSASNGGLYTGVYKGQMVEPFENWCFEEGRKHGDYGIVKTNYGFHIMYFVDSEFAWVLTAVEDMKVELGNEFLAASLEKHPSQIDYTSIVLGTVDLAAEG